MSSPPERGFVLIAALSGRALAAAAVRSGYRPLVADLFADLDTTALAAGAERVPGTLSRGFRGPALLAALDRLADGRKPAGIACGAGFEDRISLLAAIGRRHRLLGNQPKAVRAVKQPERLAALCRRTGIPHPPIQDRAGRSGCWLEKRAGGSGGVHVRPLSAGSRPRGGWHAQAHVTGTSVSALALADGKRALTLGFSEQWCAPAPGRPFRYGGAVRPASLPPGIADALLEAVSRLVAAAGLVGLNAIDFMLRPDGFELIEVNPRPGATLDVFPHRDLFAAHVAACDGVLPDSPPLFAGAAAAAVVYVPRPLAVPGDFDWPDWTADREPPGRSVARQAPLCTVLAAASDAAAARALVETRMAAIIGRMEQAHG